MLLPCLLSETAGLHIFSDEEWSQLLSTHGIASEGNHNSKLILLLSTDLVCCHPLVRRVEQVDVQLIKIKSVLWPIMCIDFLQVCSLVCDVFRVGRCCFPMLPVLLETTARYEGQ